jgi:hypothetical protein
MANIQANKQSDGSYEVAITIGDYSTTLKGSPVGSLRSEAEALRLAQTMLPIIEAEAMEYAAMRL